MSENAWPSLQEMVHESKGFSGENDHHRKLKLWRQALHEGRKVLSLYNMRELQTERRDSAPSFQSSG